MPDAGERGQGANSSGCRLVMMINQTRAPFFSNGEASSKPSRWCRGAGDAGLARRKRCRCHRRFMHRPWMIGRSTVVALMPLVSRDGGGSTSSNHAICHFGTFECDAYRVATRWRHGPKTRKPPRRAALKNLIRSEGYLVAGIGFEPMTFWL